MSKQTVTSLKNASIESAELYCVFCFAVRQIMPSPCSHDLSQKHLYYTSGNANICSFHVVFEGLISQCSVEGHLEFASLFSTII